MAEKKKKDMHYLNVSIKNSLYYRLSEFCNRYSMTKTGVTEQALQQYLDEMEKLLSEKQSAGEVTKK